MMGRIWVWLIPANVPVNLFMIIRRRAIGLSHE